MYLYGKKNIPGSTIKPHSQTDIYHSNGVSETLGKYSTPSTPEIHMYDFQV